MEWRAPSIEATEHPYILAVVKIGDGYDDDGEHEEMFILTFDGITNRWSNDHSHFTFDDIVEWMPIPERTTTTGVGDE